MPISWELLDGAGDRSGDGTSDLLWRMPDGSIRNWDVQASGGVRPSTFSQVSDEWDVVEAKGDYNADGRADILWRHNTGATYIWEMEESGVSGRDFVNAATSARIVEATTDRNADGTSDVLWRDADGTVSLWAMDANLGFASTPLGGSVSNEWQVLSF